MGEIDRDFQGLEANMNVLAAQELAGNIYMGFGGFPGVLKVENSLTGIPAAENGVARLNLQELGIEAHIGIGGRRVQQDRLVIGINGDWTMLAIADGVSQSKHGEAAAASLTAVSLAAFDTAVDDHVGTGANAFLLAGLIRDSLYHAMSYPKRWGLRGLSAESTSAITFAIVNEAYGQGAVYGVGNVTAVQSAEYPGGSVEEEILYQGESMITDDPGKSQIIAVLGRDINKGIVKHTRQIISGRKSGEETPQAFLLPALDAHGTLILYSDGMDFDKLGRQNGDFIAYQQDESWDNWSLISYSY